MTQEKQYKELIPETVPLIKQRKGGAATLLLAALMVEAGRMLDDGFDIPSVETAARKAFKTDKGFLSWTDEVGLEDAISTMEALADPSDSSDPLYQNFHNFFTPPDSFLKMSAAAESGPDAPSAAIVSDEDRQKEVDDFMLLDVLQRRFLAVAFMVSAEMVDSGIVSFQDAESLGPTSLRWKEGAFSLMNNVGMEETMKMVVEKMELSHRNEINFPIPKLLITQSQKNAPWRL